MLFAYVTFIRLDMIIPQLALGHISPSDCKISNMKSFCGIKTDNELQLRVSLIMFQSANSNLTDFTQFQYLIAGMLQRCAPICASTSVERCT